MPFQDKAEDIRENNNHEKKHGNLGRLIRATILLILFLCVTNPVLIPFQPGAVKENVNGTWQRLFSDIGQIASTFTINGITFFKLIDMILIDLTHAHIHPKSGKGKSLQTLALSGSNWVCVLVGFFLGLSILGVSIGTIFASIWIVALVIGLGAESFSLMWYPASFWFLKTIST